MTADQDVDVIAARRLARGIGQKSFANGRAVRRLFLAAKEEAKTEYLRKKGAAGLHLTKFHVIGKEPTRQNLPKLDRALKELDGKTGLKSVKKELQQLVDLALGNWRKETRAEKIVDVPLNRLFLGTPPLYYSISQSTC